MSSVSTVKTVAAAALSFVALGLTACAAEPEPEPAEHGSATTSYVDYGDSVAETTVEGDAVHVVLRRDDSTLAALDWRRGAESATVHLGEVVREQRLEGELDDEHYPFPLVLHMAWTAEEARTASTPEAAGAVRPKLFDNWSCATEDRYYGFVWLCCTRTGGTTLCTPI